MISASLEAWLRPSSTSQAGKDPDHDQVEQPKGHKPRSCRNQLRQPNRRSQYLRRALKRYTVGGSVPSSRALSGGEHEFAPDVASLADPLGVSGAVKWIRASYRGDQVATRGQPCQSG
jgi:hypothetical protein